MCKLQIFYTYTVVYTKPDLAAVGFALTWLSLWWRAARVISSGGGGGGWSSGGGGGGGDGDDDDGRRNLVLSCNKMGSKGGSEVADYKKAHKTTKEEFEPKEAQRMKGGIFFGRLGTTR